MDPRSNAPVVPGTTGLNALLWFIQVFLAIQFLIHGWIFISPPAVMAEAMAGMGLSPGFRQFIGFAEVLASIGLVLPGLTRILPWLTPLAALGLVIVMASATIFHISRNEVPSASSTANLLVLVAVTAYLRWKVVPIRSRAPNEAA
ncbi:MAG: DoxX family protein [bacterium]